MLGWIRKQNRDLKIGHRNTSRRPLAVEGLEGRISLSGVGVDVQVGAQAEISIALSVPTSTRQN